MAMSLRRALALAVLAVSGVSPTVDAQGVEMLLVPHEELHGSSYRMLAKDDANESTTTSESATRMPTDTEATTSEAVTTAEEEDDTPTSKAIITGSASLSVENATEFCANDEALEVIAKVLKDQSGAEDVEVTCETGSRRLGAGGMRRLQETVNLLYTMEVEADSETSAKVTEIMSKIEELDVETLQTLIQQELDAAGIEVEVTVLELSAPEVEIETPTTTVVTKPGVDAGSRLGLGLSGLLAAALSLALRL